MSQKLITYGFWFYQELLPLLCAGKEKIELETPNYGSFQVTAINTRFRCFKRTPRCASCDLEGVFWLLQSHGRLNRKCQRRPHLNLWACTSKGGLVMMTQDHIWPKSKGGPNTQWNLQTMCSICNQKKGDSLPDGYEAGYVHLTRMDGRSSTSERLQEVREPSLSTIDSYWLSL